EVAVVDLAGEAVDRGQDLHHLAPPIAEAEEALAGEGGEAPEEVVIAEDDADDQGGDDGPAEGPPAADADDVEVGEAGEEGGREPEDHGHAALREAAGEEAVVDVIAVAGEDRLAADRPADDRQAHV